MASYADAASKGPHQSATQARAPPIPEVVHKEPAPSESEPSLIDVDTPHVSTVSSEFLDQDIKTQTQADRLDIEAEDRQRAKGKAPRKAESLFDRLSKNTDNPVLIGNAVVSAALAGLLGYSGYRWLQRGAQGGWTAIVGAVAAVGIFATGDYFITRWALGKYPPRQ